LSSADFLFLMFHNKTAQDFLTLEAGMLELATILAIDHSDQ
tara:strand:+ start:145 stop:267 length:123 start_codon:yes stop_codon:yes gene_type:complete